MKKAVAELLLLLLLLCNEIRVIQVNGYGLGLGLASELAYRVAVTVMFAKGLLPSQPMKKK